jgi:hypothetical protein
MAFPNAHRIKTYSFAIPLGQVLILGETEKRTYLAIMKTTAHKTDTGYIWVGPDSPAAITEWIPLSEDTIRTMVYDRGVYGPIYMAMDGLGDSGLLIQSNLIEPDYASLELIL